MPTAIPESVTAAKQQQPHPEKVPKQIQSYTGRFLYLGVATDWYILLTSLHYQQHGFALLPQTLYSVKGNKMSGKA